MFFGLFNVYFDLWNCFFFVILVEISQKRSFFLWEQFEILALRTNLYPAVFIPLKHFSYAVLLFYFVAFYFYDLLNWQNFVWTNKLRTFIMGSPLFLPLPKLLTSPMICLITKNFCQVLVKQITHEISYK